MAKPPLLPVSVISQGTQSWQCLTPLHPKLLHPLPHLSLPSRFQAHVKIKRLQERESANFC